MAKIEPLRRVGSLDDLDRALADLVQAAAQLLATVIAVGKDMAEPGISVPNGSLHVWSAVSVLHADAMDDQTHHETERVNQEMTLAALDPLAGIEAANAATFGGFDALAVDHAGRRTALATFQITGGGDKMVINPAQQAAVAQRVAVGQHRQLFSSRALKGQSGLCG